jgi:predicted ester cyclase
VAHPWTVTGTHRGELMGIDATARRVAVDGLVVNRMVDRKIAERWALSDSGGLLEQLGARP